MRTALYVHEKESGARFVDFHGWELPIQYEGILKEHQSVRTGCGMFDVSHMGQVFVEGKGAFDFLNWINSNDLKRAVPGKGVYSHLLNESGGVVDDVINFCISEGRYLVVVNAATAENDFRWMQSHAGGFNVELKNKSGFYSMIAVQGPRSSVVMASVVPGAANLARFGILEAKIYGQMVFVSRTGYTGEEGFEIVLPNEIAGQMWENLIVKGRPHGIVPCGLGARDTLRLEAGYLLYGLDIDENHSPLEAGYGWVVRFDKERFIGKEALLRHKEGGLSRRLVGFRLLERGVPRPGADIIMDSAKVGTLTSGTFSPTLQRGIGMGYVESAGGISVGRMAAITIHGRQVPAEVSDIPFYRREGAWLAFLA